MSAMTSYIVFWMIFFVLLGAFWYVIDRHYGVKWYRRWFRLTHKEPLPEDVVAGFVYNRRTRHKALMATVLSTIQTGIALVQMDNLNLLVELILWIVEVPMTLVGFGLGPWAYRLWRRKDAVFDKIDEWEGAVKPDEDEANGPKAKRGRAAIEAELAAMQAETKETKPEAEPKEAEPPKKPDDPRDALRRYTDR